MSFRIERAHAAQVEDLCAIERTAVQLFRGHPVWPFYAAAFIPQEQLLEAVERGLVWTAIDSVEKEPVGFIWLDVEQGGSTIGIAEINVLPAFGRRGIGAALLETACSWARAAGYRRVDLGTLPDVPWNAEFYLKHGFSVVDKRDASLAFARDRDRENGFPDNLRVFMSRPLVSPAATEWTVWPAPAKLNLFLRITSRRPDGYHELQTVFRLLDWGDEVRLRVREDGAIRRMTDIEGVAEADDLLVRAAALLQARSGTSLGVDIAIDKRIPMGGGLGGGSSDAASVLVGLNHLWGCEFDQNALAEMGLQLGSDVPVFVRGRCAWGQGVGDRLKSISLPTRWYVVVDPRESVPTAALFQATELTRNAPAATISSFASGETVENAFEPVVRARHPRVAAALNWLATHGHARLSGSGGCVFIETATPELAEAIAKRCPSTFSAWVARGVRVSPLHKALSRHREID